MTAQIAQTARTAGPYSVDSGVANFRSGRRAWQLIAAGTQHDPRPRVVATFTSSQRDDADTVVQACNAHDDLVAALRRAEAYIHMRDECTPHAQSIIQQSIAALAKAGAL